MTEDIISKDDIDTEDEHKEEIQPGNLSSEDLLKVERGEKLETDEEDEDLSDEEKAAKEKEKEDENLTDEEKVAKAKEKEEKDKKDEGKEKELEADKEGNVKISKEDYDKLKKRVDDKEDHIKKIEEDNFKLREAKRGKVKDLEQRVTDLTTELEEAWAQGGTEASEAMGKVNKAKEDLTAAQAEEIQAGNKAIIDKFTPDLVDLVPDIVELLKSDEAGDTVIDQFTKSPYLFDPGLVVNLAKRVQLSKDIIKEKTRVTELEKEIETLKKKPGKILDEIEKQTNKGKKMTGKTGGGTEDEGKDKKTSIYSMSSEDLRKIEQGK